MANDVTRQLPNNNKPLFDSGLDYVNGKNQGQTTVPYIQGNSGNLNYFGTSKYIANEVRISIQGGFPLDASTRKFMESRFGFDFSNVRIHTDEQAAKSAGSLNARAYTEGNHITFGRSQYSPHTGEGKTLLAHELAHVVQQNAETKLINPSIIQSAQPSSESNDLVRFTRPLVRSRTQMAPNIVQRQVIEGGGVTPGKGEGIDLIFIMKAPDDQFTADVTKYVKTVLHGQAYVEVDNINDIFDYLASLQPSSNIWERVKQPLSAKSSTIQQKVRRIRIVAHGSTQGDVKMTPRSETKRRWVSADEVSKYVQNAKVQNIVRNVMTEKATVEFWGCNIGKVAKAGEAWSRVFHSTFKATTETFKTGFEKYYRHADAGEKGEALAGQKGSWIRVRNSKEISTRNKELQSHYRNWLLMVYSSLVANGDISPIRGENNQIKYMSDLFDRSEGDIKYLMIERKAESRQVRPGDEGNWAKLWSTFTLPQSIWEQTLEQK